jgi:PAS domain S-box-containing protein
MSTDPLRDGTVLSVFEAGVDSFEPQTTAAVAEALDRPREQVTDVLKTLSERGQVDSKPVGESRIWWPTESSDGRTPDGELEAEQRRRLDLFENIQDIANVGAWEYDIEADEGWGTDEVLRIHGLEPGSHVSPEESLEFYHPDDRETIREGFERAVKCQEPYDLELRFIDADGNRRWIRSRGQAQYEDGEAVRVHGTIQDITERVERERQLQQERQRYTTLFEALPNPVLHATVEDGEPVVETVNPAFEDTFGYDVETIQDEPIQDYILPDDQADATHKLNQRGLAEGDVQREIQRETTDGIRTFRLNVSTRNTETEAVEGYAVYTDITERKQTERTLKQERDLVTGIVETVPVGLSVVDADGSISFVNEQMESIAGRSLEELEDMSHDDSRYDLVDKHGEPLESGETPFDHVVFRETAITNQVVGVRRPSGERVWLSVHGAPQYDDNGTLERTVFAFEDITERKERERELERKTRAIEEAPVGISITGPSQADNPLIYVNRRFEEMTGYAKAEAIGQNCRFLQGDDTSSEPVAKIRQGIDDNEPVSAELRNYRKDGTEFWNHLKIAPVEDESGVVSNYVGFQQDVTERKERDQEIQELNRQLQSILDTVAAAIFLKDSDGRYLKMNQRARDLFDLADDETVIGMTDEDLFPEDVAAQYRADDERVFENNESIEIEEEVPTEDGTRIHLTRKTPVTDEDGNTYALAGISTDITNRKERERALEKRERILCELNTATREFHPPKSATEVGEFLIDFVDTAFEFEYVSVKRFDEQEGILQPAVRSSDHEWTGELGPVAPGTNPIWEVYRQGDSQLFDGDALEEYDGLDALTNQMLVVPIGDFGVLVTFTTGDSEFDHVDTDLIEVVATNAESAFQRLRSDSVRTEIVEELSTQQTRVAELRSVIAAIQSIQRRLAGSESRDALETGLCEELLETNTVDFAWVGRPRSGDTDLRPTAWAGDGSAYLDAVETGTPDELVPAQRAAADRDPYCHNNIPSLVVEQAWAKDALSAEFRSVVSVPLVYDDVLYGVLTAYSQDEDVFDQMYEHLFTDVASLLVNYSRLLEHRFDATQQETTELEFELSDPTYPLQRLAANTGSRIRFDTVVENMTDEICVLGTVLDGDRERVRDAASSVTSIVDAQLFGDQDQISLTVQKPFLASVVGKHRGKLVHSVSDESGTRFRVHLPKTASNRPLLDSLSSRYREIEPVAQRQTDIPRLPGTQQVASILTDRQYEILNAAYHGGYYETPRQVTGEDLAESFDISSPAIYNHLQSAHRTLLETIMRSTSGIRDEKGGLNS